MNTTLVNSSQQPIQLNSTGQAEEPRAASSFCGRVCAAAKRVVDNIGYCSVYVAVETVGCATTGYYLGESDTYSNSSIAYASAVMGASWAVAACFVGSYLLECLESVPEKTAESSKTK